MRIVRFVQLAGILILVGLLLGTGLALGIRLGLGIRPGHPGGPSTARSTPTIRPPTTSRDGPSSPASPASPARRAPTAAGLPSPRISSAQLLVGEDFVTAGLSNEPADRRSSGTGDDPDWCMTDASCGLGDRFGAQTRGFYAHFVGVTADDGALFDAEQLIADGTAAQARSNYRALIDDRRTAQTPDGVGDHLGTAQHVVVADGVEAAWFAQYEDDGGSRRRVPGGLIIARNGDYYGLLQIFPTEDGPSDATMRRMALAVLNRLGS